MGSRWLMFGAALTIAAPAAAQPPSPHAAAGQSHASDCFYITQLENDRPLNDRSVLMRVNVSDYYRLDFADTCPSLTYPEPKLILTPVGGIGLICHALDLDVKVGQNGPGDFPVPCIPSALHRMTPAEVAAIPKKDLP